MRDSRTMMQGQTNSHPPESSGRFNSEMGTDATLKAQYDPIGPHAKHYGQVEVRDQARAVVGDVTNIYYYQAHNDQDENLPESRQRFLESLRYPEMDERISQIRTKDSATFNWMFDDYLRRPWESLSKWLRQSGGIYWLHGKAGSGKSTLMKALWEHEQTQQCLSTDSSSMSYILKYSFWLPGVPMQKNFKGMLCSLLFQILYDDSSSIDALLAKQKSIKTKSTVLSWSVEELMKLTLELVQQREKRTCVCFFLDGLDEIEKVEDRENLLRLVDILADSTRVKFCLSSRFEYPWVDEFRDQPQLRLQDLTRPDIEAYVSNRLQRAWRKNPRFSSSSQQYSHLVREIAAKASGVFLWVSLAVTSLLEGSRGASWDELETRLDHLPTEVASLYEDMLRRRGRDTPDVHREAATYMKLCLDRSKTSLGGNDLCIHHCVLLRHMFFSKDSTKPYSPTFDQFEADCREARERIRDICAGMISFRRAGILTLCDLRQLRPGPITSYYSGDTESSLTDSGDEALFIKAKASVHKQDSTIMPQLRLNWDSSSTDTEVSTSRSGNKVPSQGLKNNRRQDLYAQAVDDGDEQPSSCSIESSQCEERKIYRMKLEFHHRTITDFLEDTAAGQEVIQRCSLTVPNILSIFTEAELILFRLGIDAFDRAMIQGILGRLQDFERQHHHTLPDAALAQQIKSLVNTLHYVRAHKATTLVPGNMDFLDEGQYIYDILQKPYEQLPVDIAGLTLHRGMKSFFNEYLAPFLRHEGHCGVKMTQIYKDYLLACAVKGDLPDIALTLVSAGADLYARHRRGSKWTECAAVDLLMSLLQGNETVSTRLQRWSTFLEAQPAKSCYAFLYCEPRGRMKSPAGEWLSFGVFCRVFVALDIGLQIRLLKDQISQSEASAELKHPWEYAPSEYAGLAMFQDSAKIVPLTMQIWQLLVGEGSRKHLYAHSQDEAKSQLIDYLKERVTQGCLADGCYVLSSTWSFLVRSDECAIVPLQDIFREERDGCDIKRKPPSLAEVSDYERVVPATKKFKVLDSKTEEKLKAFQDHAVKLGLYDEHNSRLLQGPIPRFQPVESTAL